MSVSFCFFAQNQLQVVWIWGKATLAGRCIIFILVIFSIFAWYMMVAKALQMRRAKRLDLHFDTEFRGQKDVLGIFDRRLQVNGCPMFAVYQEGCVELDTRLKGEAAGEARKRFVSLKSMEHIKRTLEGAVARESLKLEAGLILLAIAVSGAPFLGLLGTVWGVMDTFAQVGQAGKADLPVMAPGVSAALITTVAGLLVAIPSMFAYNWLVHTLRVRTVELDNFAQNLVSKMETEYLKEE
ncbi:MAG TPA: MotA/TolQ/ExbB proton channel family protein [Verrucomicrobiae bacterium]|jgi:biopolymer transport protein ExbB/TolQ|nr:MotA/TolQ/ExbB proton channel family protein [Verrucomicrobiae bacterium]